MLGYTMHKDDTLHIKAKLCFFCNFYTHQKFEGQVSYPWLSSTIHRNYNFQTDRALKPSTPVLSFFLSHFNSNQKWSRRCRVWPVDGFRVQYRIFLGSLFFELLSSWLAIQVPCWQAAFLPAINICITQCSWRLQTHCCFVLGLSSGVKLFL